MLIKAKIGNLDSFNLNHKTVDWLDLDWHEANKRIMHKRSSLGTEVVMKFMSENQQLTQGDVLYEDEKSVIAIHIKPCEALIIRPKNMYEMACICYEIGNKHLPLFYLVNEVLVAFDAPLFRLLASGGYEVEKGERKLINPLKTTVAAHGNSGSETLFSKIMRLTNPQE